MTEHHVIFLAIFIIILIGAFIVHMLTLKCKCDVCKRAGKTLNGH